MDLKNKYHVTDIKKHIAGALYSDSSHVTGVDRAITHLVDCSERGWDMTNDFQKGWLVHLLVDKTQAQVVKEDLPDIFLGELSYGSESWVKYAAIKTLQDLEDVRSFNIEEYLDYLEFIENPNGEDLEKLKKYNKTFFKMYANPRQSGIESYYDMWRGLEVGDRLRELALKIKDEAEKYSQNESTMLIVRGIYQKTLEGILTL